MTCIYKDDCDQCSLYVKEDHDGLTYRNSEFGFSEENDGTCAVAEDEDPANSCSMFEGVEDGY